MRPVRACGIQLLKIFVLLLTLTLTARGQSPSAALDQSFAVGSGAGFPAIGTQLWPQIQAVAVQPDGKVLAAGQAQFVAFNGTPVPRFCRINVDGTLDTAFAANVGTGPTEGANSGTGEINRIIVQPDGKILICGVFNFFNGVSRVCVARLNADGTLDTSFIAAGGGINGGAVKYALDLALQPDGKILLGGGFTSYLGTSRWALARLNTDGMLDTNFVHGFPAGLGVNTVVQSIGVQNDGKIYVGGSFTNWLGLPTPGIVRLLPNGSLDSTFTPQHQIPVPQVNTIIPTDDGKLLISGFIEGDGTNIFRNFARLNTDGSMDNSYAASTDVHGWVADIQPWPEGGHLISGRFRDVAGHPRGELALIDANGNVNLDFAPQPLPTNDLIHIYTLAVAPDGKIVFGGWLDNYPNGTLLNGQNYSGIGRLIGGYSPGPGKLQFTSASVTVNEDAATATLTVSRFGGSTGAVGVSFATAQGTAQAGSDFTTTNGTLSWAAGEFGKKTITIPILADAISESSEAFTVALSSPTGGATIGVNGTATVTIKDDDSVPTITRQPLSQSVYLSFPVLFSVGVDSALSVSYQWLSNNVPILGATSPLLSLTNVQTNFGPNYSVVISNSIGAITSSVATLTIIIPAGLPNPQFTTPGTGLNGDVYDVQFQADGKLVGVGAFSQYGGTNLPVNVIRLNPDGSRDTAFPAAAAGATGSSAIVQSLTPTPDGKWIIAGNFTQYNGTNRSRVAKLNGDGSLDASFVPNVTSSFVYTTIPQADGKVLVGEVNFVRRLMPNGTNDTTYTNATLVGQVYSMLAMPNGKTLVSAFRSSAPSGSELFLLNPDGTRDYTYIGSGRFAGGTISKMSRMPDGRIFISGGFSSLASNTSTNPLPYVAMLTAEGLIDTSFPAQTTDSSVISHVVQADGRIILGGAFTVWNGITSGRYLRLLPNGTVDPIFISGTGANAFVRAVAIDANGRVAIGGAFTTVNQQSRGRIALLTDGVGSVHFTTATQTINEQAGTFTVFVDRAAGSRGAVSIDYATIAGTASAGTDFTATSGTFSWADGESGTKSFVVSINNDASTEEDETFSLRLSNPTGGVLYGLATNQLITILDSNSAPRISVQPLSITRPEEVSASFSVTAFSALPITYQWRSNGVNIVNATNPSLTLLNVQSNYSASYSVRVSNTVHFTDSSNAVLTVIASPTRRDTSFVPPTAFNGAVRAVVPLGDGRALVGGSFSLPKSYIALVNSNGTPDLSFTNTATGGSGFGPGIYDIERDSKGRWLIAGSFGQFAGVTFSNLTRLNPDFTVDTNFLVALGTAPNGLVRDVTVGPDGKIWLAGDFTSVGGPYGLSYLARLNENGTPDLAMFPRSNGSVYKVQPLANGKAFIGGSFSSYNSSGGSFKRINTDGTSDTTFNVSVSGSVYDIIMQPDGGFYLAGAFTSPSSRIAKFDAGGRADTILLGGAVGNSHVNSITSQANGRLIGVGDFATFGIHSNRFTRLETNGLQDTSLALGSGFNQEALRVALESNGAIWVGGSFTQYKGLSAPYLVRLNGEEPKVSIAIQPLDRVVAPGGNTIFTVTAFGTGLTYQWFKDGVALTNGAVVANAQTATLSLSGVSLANQGTYTVVVSDGLGNSATSRGAFLRVVGLPEFVTQPQGVRAPVGGKIFLSINVNGAAPLSYQWYQGTTPVGGNSPHLVITNVTLANSGTYSVVASNGFGGVQSDNAIVDVQVSPASAAPGFFQDAGLASNFDSMLALQPLPNGSLLVGGLFASLRTNGATVINRQYLGMFTSNGMADPFNPGMGNQVTDIVRQKDGKVVVVGNFTSVSNGVINRKYIARFNADMTFDSAFHAALGVGPDLSVGDVAVQPDGKILIAGSFANVSGKPNTRGVARLNANGSVDESFVSEIANFGSATLVQPLPDGRILLGSSSSYGGHNASLYRLSYYGAVDFSYTPSVGGAVIALAVQTNGAVVIGGTFTLPNGVFRPLLARLNSNGALDTNFLAGVTNFSAFNQAVIRTIAIQDNGKIVAGGNFLTFGPFRNSLARINADGTPDSAFIFQQGTGEDYNANVNRVAIFADGRIAVAGQFATWEGVAENSLVILNGDPVLLGFASEPADQFVLPNTTVQFSGQAVGSPTITYQWFKGASALTDGLNISGATTATLTVANAANADAGLYRLQISNGTGSRLSSPGELFLLGAPVFRQQPGSISAYISNSISLRAEVAGVAPITYQWFLNGANPILNATNTGLAFTNLVLTNSGNYTIVASNVMGVTTSSVATITVLIPPAYLSTNSPHPAGANGTINAIVPLGDGRIVIGGQFSSAGQNGNQTARANMALLNTNGTVDAAFNPAPNNTVEVIVRQNTGYLVGGNFGNIAGQTRANFARLNADGSLDTTFLTTLGTGPNQGVLSILVQPDGKILIGGNFSAVSGQLYPGIVRLNANGSIDSSFRTSLPSFPNIGTLSLLGDGTLYAGGNFTLSNRQNVVRFNTNGSVDTSFSTTADFQVLGVQALNDGGALISGFFQNVNGTAASSFARLTANGSLDPSWPAVKPNGSADRMVFQANGKLIVGGSFTQVGFTSRARIARYNNDGSLDLTFVPGTGFNSNVEALALEANGGIWVGGSFSTYNGTTVNNLVLLTGDAVEAPPLTPFQSWAASFGLTPANSGAGVDADGDGISNIFEYYLGTNPNSAASNPSSPLARRVASPSAFANVGGQFYPVMAFIRSKTATGVTAITQASATVGFTNPIATVEHSITDLGDGTERVLVRSTVSTAVQPTQFMRLQLMLAQ